MTSSPGTGFQFYVKPAVHSFRRNQAAEFGRHLAEIDRHTSILPIDREKELQLRDDGHTFAGRYRYTPTAFHQVVQILGPGLSRVLPDLAGQVRRSNDKRLDLIDGQMACELFNRMISLRFPLLNSMRVIRNDHARTIDGVIGAKHRFLENSAIYTMAAERLEAMPVAAQFYTAVLVSRRLALWFRSANPVLTTTYDGVSWPVYSGYYFANGEATGTSARGTLAVFTKTGICLGPWKRHGDRVTHAGRDFSQRLGAMLDKVLNQTVPVTEWDEGIRRMQATNLGFGDKIGKAKKTHERAYLAALSQLGVEQSISGEAVDSALQLGANAPDRIIADMQPLVASRTLFDLFGSLLRVSRRLSLSRREKVEQAAYEVLVGRLPV